MGEEGDVLEEVAAEPGVEVVIRGHKDRTHAQHTEELLLSLHPYGIKVKVNNAKFKKFEILANGTSICTKTLTKLTDMDATGFFPTDKAKLKHDIREIIDARPGKEQNAKSVGDASLEPEKVEPEYIGPIFGLILVIALMYVMIGLVASALRSQLLGLSW
eukprot:TRINITY_DN101347_c0_g1_i1.p1 TRINITY_DN101347_c0_g1~~TRINITY_DN101347_c0_g1_i1.p1  ORF type:complete len:160 (-),score=29.28 TRINITY_DN101347_c0_g1_i1:20-499(-)